MEEDMVGEVMGEGMEELVEEVDDSNQATYSELEGSTCTYL